MGFNKKYIKNSYVITTYKENGITGIIQLYRSKTDVLLTEDGLASDLLPLLNDPEWSMHDPVKLGDIIVQKIHEYLGIHDIEK